MNLGLTTSFIIGGLLLLTIGVFNLRLGQHGNELTLHQMSKTQAEAVYQTLMNDLNKIGYNRMNTNDGTHIEDGTARIQLADSTRIGFQANINDAIIDELPTVLWEFTTEEIPGSSNPNHRVLERTISQQMVIDTPNQSITTGATEEEVERIAIGVSRFELRYFSADSNTPLNTPVSESQLGDIKRIEVIMEVQPREGVSSLGGDVRFPTTQWRRMIAPKNINLEENDN